MIWCSHCGRNCKIASNYTTNNISCIDCGKVLFEDIYTEEATYVKDSAGGAHLTGNFVGIEDASFESKRRTLAEGNVVTNELIYKYGITNVSHAIRHYEGKEMLWCPHCAKKGKASHDYATRNVYCVDCGKVLYEEIYTEKAFLSKDATRGPIRKTNCSNDSNVVGEVPGKEDDETDDSTTIDNEDDHSETEGRDWSYDDEEEMYDYDGGDEDGVY